MLEALSLLLLFLLAAPGVSRAGESTGTAATDALKQAREWVQALGSETYSVRSRAKIELLKLGRPALEPLQEGILCEDSEIRLRCIELLLALRGRGFLGVGLRDEAVAMLMGGGGALGGMGGAAGADADTPPVVAETVLQHKDPNYARTKPFPAEAAGIQPGDRFITINRRPILRLNDLFYEIITSGPGRLVIVDILRGEQRLRLPVVLTRNQGDSQVPVQIEDEQPAMPAAAVKKDIDKE